MKLWLDDVRPAPEGWHHVRTAEAAREVLRERFHEIEECSLDHDLGYDGPLPGPCEACGGTGTQVVVDANNVTQEAEVMCGPCDGDGFIGGDVLYTAADSDDDGTKLARWMALHARVPHRINVHSWNPEGAKAMLSWFNQYVAHFGEGTYEFTYKPYRVPGDAQADKIADYCEREVGL